MNKLLQFATGVTLCFIMLFYVYLTYGYYVYDSYIFYKLDTIHDPKTCVHFYSVSKYLGWLLLLQPILALFLLAVIGRIKFMRVKDIVGCYVAVVFALCALVLLLTFPTPWRFAEVKDYTDIEKSCISALE